MHCCENCFKDKLLRSYISQNSTTTGTCTICNSEEQNLILFKELEDKFIPLIEPYSTCSELGIDKSKGKPYHEQIIEDWSGLFKIGDISKVKLILDSIFGDLIATGMGIFKENVVVERKYNPTEEEIPFDEKFWDKFKDEIKHENRFFLQNRIDAELLTRLLVNNSLNTIYTKGKILFRARISDREGHLIERMGKPPKELASAGRANPTGISYLYLSSNLDTTLYEVRAAIHDFVSVAEFKILEDINTLNLYKVTERSPFDNEDIASYLVHKEYLIRLENELKKPVRRQDSLLDYLPTQYLTEFVKINGFDGLQFGSSLHEGGINIVLFDDNKVMPVSVSIYQVNSIKYEYSKV